MSGPRLPLFDGPEEGLPPQAERLAPRLRALAERGVYFGGSSWKYPGWIGGVYSAQRYATRGKFSKAKFEAECLSEYAQTFPTVCGDFTFYQFPSAETWRRVFEQTPASFLFGFKVPEEITVARWPNHVRYGERAGAENRGFLDAALLRDQFLRPLEPYADRVAVLIFEFGTFAKSTFPTVDHFLARLDHFLDGLPDGPRFGVEIRNPEYLGPGYFACLASHGVAHVMNAWTRMPELETQLDMPGAETADFSVARALLPRGRLYEQAVRSLQPYEEVRAPNPPARAGLRRMAENALRRKRPTFLFVNNRLEGNSPTTIEAVVEEIRP